MDNTQFTLKDELYDILDNYSLADTVLLNKFFELIVALDQALDDEEKKKKALYNLSYFWNNEGVT